MGSVGLRPRVGRIDVRRWVGSIGWRRVSSIAADRSGAGEGAAHLGVNPSARGRLDGVPKRPTPTRRWLTAATWPVGVGLTSWDYMWRSTPMHRREILEG